MFKSDWGHWSKCWNIFLLRLDLVRLTYRTILIPRNACYGISSRELHRCVRIEKPSNLGFCFAQFGVRKCPKTIPTGHPFSVPTWHQVGFLKNFWNPSLEPTAQAEHPNRPSGFIFHCQLDKCFNLSSWSPFLFTYYGIAQFCPNPFSLLLSLTSSSSLDFSPLNPRFCSLSHLNLST